MIKEDNYRTSLSKKLTVTGLASLVFLMNYWQFVWKENNGRSAELLANHTTAYYVGAAILGSLILPLLHMALSSFFKSKRNSESRWNICLGWALIQAVPLLFFIHQIVTVG
ncbi:hypothetical protein [Pseudomonas brenneri]|uniref:hypothetical protein n=1 Tax=Pseudomonas brenneri TaxID=129817 RepID=UPI003BA0A4EC